MITAGLVLGALACAKTTESSNLGTNTNWMRSCDAAGDCEDGEACLCGLCTVTCDDSDECAVVHESTRCEMVQAGTCEAQTAGVAACLQGCGDDDDCTALQDGRCESGLCVATAASSAECAVHADCYGSPIANAQGRCAPEVACIDGVCDAWCPSNICTTTQEETNECDQGWICADPRVSGITIPACRATEIPCETADQCPKHKPSSMGEWTCEADICRFPGFRYLYENPPDPRYTLERDGADVAITDAYTGCQEHDDCVLAPTSCNGCCNEAAIKRELATTYELNAQAACEGYQGSICDCDFADLVPRCLSGRCRAEQRASVGCYAPEINDDGAYDEGAVGCRCDGLDGRSICTSAALICEVAERGRLVWQAVEDGPCGEPEPDPTCADGELRDTPEACLASFKTCHRVPSGEYCGEIVITEP
jgi:hypothetical protein